jgi:ABC-type sugar transport system permease subunit
MKRQLLTFALVFLASLTFAQNKDTAQISITNYRLIEGSTHNWRGTSTYFDMTSWDSSPYGQGHLQQKSGANWFFRMNYRLLQPLGYNPSYSPGYPMAVVNVRIAGMAIVIMGPLPITRITHPRMRQLISLIGS